MSECKDRKQKARRNLPLFLRSLKPMYQSMVALIVSQMGLVSVSCPRALIQKWSEGFLSLNAGCHGHRGWPRRPWHPASPSCLRSSSDRPSRDCFMSDFPDKGFIPSSRSIPLFLR